MKKLLETAVLAFLICGCQEPTQPPTEPPPPEQPPGPIQYPRTIFLGLSEEEVMAGDSVTLTWAVHNGTNVVLNPGNVSLDASGSMEVEIDQSTTFVLTGESEGQKVQTSARVLVLTP